MINLDHLPSPEVTPDPHTCPRGPFCAQMEAACDPWGYRADHPYEVGPLDRPCCHLPAMAHPPGECGHWSCGAIAHETCPACFAELYVP